MFLNLKITLTSLVGVFAFSTALHASLDEQYLRLEHLRYQHDILGNSSEVKRELKNMVSNAKDKSILSTTLYFLGILYDQEGKLDSASQIYLEALKDSKLGQKETEWIYRRLGKINPELIQGVVLKKGKVSKIINTFPMGPHTQSEYVLQTQLVNSTLELNKNFLKVNPKGETEELNLELGPEEKLLDYKEGLSLLLGKGFLKLLSQSPATHIPLMDQTEIIYAEILDPTTQKFLVQRNQSLDFYDQGILQQTLNLKEKDCHWQSDNNLREGTLFCKEGAIYRVDLESHSMYSISPLTQKPYFIQTSSQRAVIQFFNHFEVRTGNKFHKTIWKNASRLSDKVFITSSSVYLLDAKGTLRSFNIETGQMVWEREMELREVFPTDREIYGMSHAQACIGISLDGEINWTYEYGWDSQVTPVLGQNYLILFYQDGRQIHLNLDLIQISQSSNVNKMMDLMDTHTSNQKEIDWNAQLGYVNSLLKTEPGNGMGWNYKFMCLKKLEYPEEEQFKALIQAARSLYSPAWSQSPILQTLNSFIESRWIWKRAYGQKYYPNLVPNKDLLVYLENNNQTLKLLHAKTGINKESIHIPEELDSKLLEWVNERIIASSPTKIYSVPTSQSGTGTQTLSLAKPICKTVLIGDILFISDWFGNLLRIDASEGLPKAPDWNRNYSTNGLLLGSVPDSPFIDAVDIHGKYFSLSKKDGEPKFSMELPEGTITDIHSQKDKLFIGYDDGRLLALERSSQKILWSRTFSNQIFSLEAATSELLVVTTSSKRLYCLDSRNGGFKSEITIPTSLINKPIPVSDGYWLGTSFPALEKRDFNHNLIKRYKLTALPGNPVVTSSTVYVSTLDGFIFAFSL